MGGTRVYFSRSFCPWLSVSVCKISCGRVFLPEFLRCRKHLLFFAFLRMWSGVDVEWMWNRSEVNVERMWSGCGLDYGHNWAEANCYLGSVHRTKSAQNGHFSSQQYFLPVPNVQRSIKSWDYMTHSVQTLILLWPLLFRALIGFYGNKQHQSHLRGRCCKQSSVKLVMVSRIFHKSNK